MADAGAYVLLSTDRVVTSGVHTSGDRIGTVAVATDTGVFHLQYSTAAWLEVAVSRSGVVLTATGITPLSTETVRIGVYNSDGTFGATAAAFFDVVYLVGDYLDVDPQSLAFGAAGGTGTVIVRSSDSWRAASSLQTWLSVSPTLGQAGETAVSVTAAENGNTVVRTVEQEFTTAGLSASLSVTQGGADPTLELSPSSLVFGSSGGILTVEVTSSDGTLHADTSTVPSWLSVSLGASVVTGALAAFVTAAENTSEDARTAEVRLYSTSGAEAFLEVTQEGAGWNLRHYGEFPDIKGNTWRCEVLVRGGDAAEPAELEFPADSPLAVEWPSTNFEDAVWGSSATLRVVSPGDRTYIDLYTIEPGTIRLDVYRNGSLFWSGALDPEFYEEPYERLSGYEVELTFTDFGILDRLKYNLEGVQAVRDILNDAIDRSGINHTRKSMAIRFDYERTGIRFGADRAAQERDLFESTMGIAVSSDNFTDEEGEAMTMAEAVEGILQPLGLKMTQRGGQVRLLDPTGLRERLADLGQDAPAAVWTGDSQTLGVDRVYNNVKVTFSPYVPDGAMPALAYDGEWDADTINTGTDTSQTCWTFFPDYSSAHSDDYDFTIFSDGSAGASNATAYTGRFFHIEPDYGSADSCDGYAFGFRVGHTSAGGSSSVGNPPGNGRDTTSTAVVFPRVFLPALTTGRNSVYIRLVAELLADCRYNPFSGADSDNDSSNQSTLESNSAFVFARARVTLYDAPTGGSAICHYETLSALLESGGRGSIINGTWEDGEDTGASTWLEFYNPDDLADNSGGAGGWKANRQCVGKPDGQNGRNRYTECNAMFRNCGDGEYLPYFPTGVGGWLQVELTSYLHGHRWGSSNAPADSGDSWGSVGDELRWRLWRNVQLSLVSSGRGLEDIDGDDIERTGTLNADAQDGLDIDTVCGTCDGASPAARGQFLRLGTLAAVPLLYRDGSTACPETLLINQLYRQYAGRKAVITGEAEPPEDFLLTEDNQPGKTFMLTSESLDARMGTSDIEIRELGEDTYTPA